MSAFSDALSVTTTGLQAQAARLRLLSENIANADTPGYHRKTVAFEMQPTLSGVTGVRLGDVRLDRSELALIHDPANPLADANGDYRGSNVDLIIEIADAREAQRSYEANLKVFQQTREMSAGLLELLRR